MSLEHRWPLVRDVLAFVIGAVGVLSQVPWFNDGPIDPAAVALFGPLVGAPFFLRRNGGGG